MVFLNEMFYGNPVWVWFLALVITILVVVVLRALRRVILRRLTAFAKRTASEVDDLVADLLART